MKKKIFRNVSVIIFSATFLLQGAAAQAEDFLGKTGEVPIYTGAPASSDPLRMAAYKGSSSGGWNVSTLTSFGLPGQTITGIVVNIMMWLLFMLGIVGVIGFVISGLMYLISTGDQTMIDRAKKGMTYSIVGIIVGLAGVVIIQAINAILNASITI